MYEFNYPSSYLSVRFLQISSIKTETIIMTTKYVVVIKVNSMMLVISINAIMIITKSMIIMMIVSKNNTMTIMMLSINNAIMIIVKIMIILMIISINATMNTRMIIMMVSINNAIMISPYRLGTSLHRGSFTKWGIATSGMSTIVTNIIIIVITSSLAGSWGQDTDEVSIYLFGVLNVSLRACGAQLGFKPTWDY